MSDQTSSEEQDRFKFVPVSKPRLGNLAYALEVGCERRRARDQSRVMSLSFRPPVEVRRTERTFGGGR